MTAEVTFQAIGATNFLDEYLEHLLPIAKPKWWLFIICVECT